MSVKQQQASAHLQQLGPMADGTESLNDAVLCLQSILHFGVLEAGQSAQAKPHFVSTKQGLLWLPTMLLHDLDSDALYQVCPTQPAQVMAH